MAASIGVIEQFDIKNGNLDTYMKRMNSYFLINKVENDVKVAAFLTLCGPKLYQEICNLLSGTIPPEELSYKKLTKLLLDHYNPKQYIVMERYKFNQRNQRKSETITEFVMAIKTLAQTCDFGKFLDDALRDRFVCGVQSNVIRNALLKEEELTMDKAKNLAVAIELAEPNERSSKMKKDKNKKGNSKNNKSSSATEEDDDDEKVENNDRKKTKKKNKNKKEESSSDNEKDEGDKMKKDKNKKGNSKKNKSSNENEDENKLSTKNYRNKDNRNDDNINVNRKTINCFRCGGVGHVSKYCNAPPLFHKHSHHRQSLTNLYVSNNLSIPQPTPSRMSTSAVTYINNNNTFQTNSKPNSNTKETPTASLNKWNIEDTWVPTTAYADLPTDAVYAGIDGESALMYIGRAIHNGVQLPAKVIPSKQISYISYDGQEIPKYQFDVLIGKCFTWMTADKGRVPSNAVVCSHLSDGEPLYIGRARFASSLIPGKIQQSHGCLYISHNGTEHRIEQYEVLIGTQRPNWKETCASSKMPDNAILGGYDTDGALMYVGRAIHNGEQLPAKIIPNKQIAYISYNGIEIPKYKFDVLCGGKVSWNESGRGVIPPGAISGGKINSGENIYIGRAVHMRSLTLGKIIPSHGKLYIAFDGYEIQFKTYQILTEL